MNGASAIRADRTSRLVLWVSLGLNLFFIGLGGAILLRQESVGEPSPPLVDRLVAALPPADRETMRASFAQHEAAINAARKEVAEAREAVRAALRAEPYDAGGLRAAMERERAARLALGTAFGEAIAAGVDGISAEGRAKLAALAPSPRQLQAERPSHPNNSGSR